MRHNFKRISLDNQATKYPSACCQKYTPKDCFFGDFAHWDRLSYFIQNITI